MKTAPKPQEKPPVREHWSTAPEAIRKRIETLRDDAVSLRIDSPAFVLGCFSIGYDLKRDEIPTPVLNAIAAGVSRREINERFGSMRHARAEIFCFPSHALSHPQMRDTTHRPKTEDEKRGVLRSLAMHAAVDGARIALADQVWWRASLIGGDAEECVSLQNYGGN